MQLPAIAGPWPKRDRSADGASPTCWLCSLTSRGDRLLRPRIRTVESRGAIRYAVTRDAEVAARLKRLDHPAIACPNGRGDPAIAIIDDGIDLVPERADMPLHLGLDASDVAIGCDRKLAEIDEQHPQLGIVCEALFDRHRQHPLA